MRNIEILITSLFFIVNNNILAQGPDCSGATQLPNVTNYCSGASFYTNTGATSSTLSLPTCWGASSTEDVWFQFTATGTDVLISVGGSGNGGTMMLPCIAIYTGSCTGTLNEMGCTNSTPGSGVSQLYEGAIIPGTLYYIRVSTINSNEGTFELCVNNYTPSANAGADCGGAAFLCNQNPLSVSSLNGGGANNDEPEASSCMENTSGADEGNSSWYYWTCGVSGTFTLDITPLNPSDDIDFIVYQLNGGANPCGPRTVIRCNSSSCLNANGSTGLSVTDIDITEDPNCDPGENAYCQFINLTAGVSYALLVNNFSANMGFTTNFGGTATFQGPNPIISTSTTTICAGQTITFNGNTSTNVGSGLIWNFLNGGSPTSGLGNGPHVITYNALGVYTAILTGTDATGCQSVETVTINVNAPPNAPVVSNLSYCQGEIAPALTATGSGLLWYANSVGGIGSANAPIPSTALLGTISYYVSQSPSGCESPRAQIDVTITPPPTMDIPFDISQCPNSSVPASTFTSIPAGATFTWTNSNPSIGLAASGLGNIPSFICTNTTGANAISTITVSPAFGTCVGQNVTYTITVYPLPLIDAGDDQGICEGSSVTLTGSGSAAYSWNNGILDGIPFIPASTTTYTLTGTSAEGCVNTDQVLVTVNPIPTVSAGVDLTVCDNDSIILSGSGASTYMWDNGITNGVPFTIPAGTIAYTVIGTSAAGCVNTDQIDVTVIPTTPVSFTPDITLDCAPMTVNFTNTTPNSVDCFWTMSDGAVINGCGPVANTFDQAGCYDITLTSTSPNGCVSSFTAVDLVCAEAAPNAQFIPSSTMISEFNTEVFFINLTTGATDYLWDFGNDSPSSTEFDPSYNYAEDDLGNYTVMLIAYSPLGCVDTSYRTIEIYEELIFYIPNTFTPDGNMFNQTFQPIFYSGYDPYNFSMLLYDRWGELIFETHNADIGWDGTYGGRLMQDGQYNWVIEFKIKRNDEKKKVTGHVNILR